VIDDASNFMIDRVLQFIEAFKQITEATGTKFILVSTTDLIPKMPVVILRSCSIELESA